MKKNYFINSVNSSVFLISVMSVMFLSDLKAQFPSNTFQRYINYTETRSKKVIPTADGGFISAGALATAPNGYDMFLLKTDFAGNSQFAVLMADSTSADHFLDVIQTPDKGYTCLGSFVHPPPFSNADVALVHFDSCGNLQWYKKYGSANADIPSTVILTSDGNYVITGYTGTNIMTDRNPFLIKTDGNGNFLWSKSYGSATIEDFGLDVIESKQGGYVMCGSDAASYTTVIKTDTAGTVQWGYKYGSGTAKTIRQEANGDYTVFIGYGSVLALLKLSSTGTIKWHKTYNVNLSPSYQTGGAGGCLTSDGGMALVGYTGKRSQNLNKMELLVIRTDSSGNTLWGKTYSSGNQLNQNGFAQQSSGQIAQTPDSGFIFGAEDVNTVNFRRHHYLIKTDKNGRTGCNFQVPITSNTSSISISWYANVLPNTIVPLTGTLKLLPVPSAVFSQNLFQCSEIYGPGTNDSLPSTGIYGAINVCPPSTNIYSIPDLGAGYQYNWGVTLGTIASGNGTPSITVNYSTTGVNWITVSITNPCGNTTTLSLIVNIGCALPPVAAFQSSDSTLCENDCIGYTDKSANNPTSWLWTFQGGTPATSNAQNPPFVCYNAAGNYTTKLIASNSNGSDSATFTNFIHVVSSPPTPTITQNFDTLRCSTDPSYTSYQWYDSSTVISGATGTYYIATHSGNYNVKVINGNGCSTAAGINVTLTGLAPHFTADEIRIYPNPATDQLLIIVGSSFSKVAQLDIYNILGENIYTTKSEIVNRKSEIQIGISSFAKGIYYVQLKDGKSCISRKFIKQ